MECYVYTKSYELIHELGICGCGAPEDTYKAVHEMLKRANNPKEPLITDPDNPFIYFMAYTLDDKGFLEHGSHVSWSWLTDKGKELLRAMDIFEKYDYNTDRVTNEMPEEFWRVEE